MRSSRLSFWIPSSFYCDDKFGIESCQTIETADRCVANLHKIGGCDYADKKRYVGTNPTILGVTYDLVKMLLEVKEDRKEELIGIMREMMRADRMTPGEAAKLKGKLGFAGSHFWGKIGRCFFRSLSERDSTRDPSEQD